MTDIKGKCEDLAEGCVNAAGLVAGEFGTLPAEQERPDLFQAATILRVVPIIAGYLEEIRTNWSGTCAANAATAAMSTLRAAIGCNEASTPAPATPAQRKVRVDAVAEAIYSEIYTDWELLHKQNKDEYRQLARAAIRACGCEPEGGE